MAKEKRLRLVLSTPAKSDLAEIAKWSFEQFGVEAALRYKALLRQALLGLAADPSPPGSKERPELLIPGVRTYHLMFSRDRMPRPRVKRPRHFIVDRLSEEGWLEVARILHDARELQRHLENPSPQ